MDGAMGTELVRLKGTASFQGLDRINLTEPDLVRSIHQSYLDAGAEVLLTNTFQANPSAPEGKAIWQAGIRIARSVEPRFLLAAVGPTESLPEEIWRECQEVDGVLLETWSSVADLASIAFCRPVTAPPLLVSFTFRRGAGGEWTTIQDASPEDCAAAARKCGAIALGANCGRDLGMADLAAIVRRYRSACELPIFVRPNAGTPIHMYSGWSYPGTPDAMASALPALLDAGVVMIGGCCGTTPEHLRAFRKVIDDHLRLAPAQK
jgi:5-methyltetrahydrofolate--homocysteine methyltransferase